MVAGTHRQVEQSTVNGCGSSFRQEDGMRSRRAQILGVPRANSAQELRIVCMFPTDGALEMMHMQMLAH